MRLPLCLFFLPATACWRCVYGTQGGGARPGGDARAEWHGCGGEGALHAERLGELQKGARACSALRTHAPFWAETGQAIPPARGGSEGDEVCPSRPPANGGARGVAHNPLPSPPLILSPRTPTT